MFVYLFREGGLEWWLVSVRKKLGVRSWEMPVKCELPAKIGRCYEKPSGHNFDFRAKSSWEKFFNIYKNFLSGGFRSKVKIVTAGLFATPTYFCWQLAFHWHLPTSGRQNTVKKGPQPLFVPKAFFPYVYRPFQLLWPITIFLFVFELEAEE